MGRYTRRPDYILTELDIKTKNDYLEILARRINERSLEIHLKGQRNATEG